MLTEWCVIIDDKENYQKFVEFKNNSLKELNLMLWFPEKATEELIYHQYGITVAVFSISTAEAATV
jgi:hypothetical protein